MHASSTEAVKAVARLRKPCGRFANSARHSSSSTGDRARGAVAYWLNFCLRAWQPGQGSCSEGCGVSLRGRGKPECSTGEVRVPDAEPPRVGDGDPQAAAGSGGVRGDGVREPRAVE